MMFSPFLIKQQMFRPMLSLVLMLVAQQPVIDRPNRHAR
jgi:hypothetical protein